VRLGRGHIKAIESLAWSNSDPSFVVTVGLDGSCLVWHAPSANKVGISKLKSNWVQTCSFRSSAGGSSGIVATAGMDNLCTLYSLTAEDMKIIHELQGHDAFIASCSFVDDSSILTASSDSSTILWDAQKNKQKAKFLFGSGCTSLAIRESTFFVGLTDGTVTLCDITSGKQVIDFECHQESLSSIALFPTETGFATAADDRTCHLYDTRSRDNALQVYTVAGKDEGDLTSIAFSKSGRFLFAGYDDLIRVWDTPKGTVAYELDVGCKTSSLAVNCDGSAMCSGGVDNDARIWCLA